MTSKRSVSSSAVNRLAATQTLHQELHVAHAYTRTSALPSTTKKYAPSMRNKLACVSTLLLTLATPMGCSMHGSQSDPSTQSAPNSISNSAPNLALVYLVSGPNSGKGSPETRKSMFAGHMANITALATEGKLFVAGPFDAPSDRTWRGIFVVRATTAEEATQIAASDPGIIAGEFVAVCHPMHAPEWLRELPEFDRRMTANTAANTGSNTAADPAQPPKNIRRYVMVTAESAERAGRAIDASLWRDRVVWSGTLTDTKQGVFVLNTEKPDEFIAAQLDLGPCKVDGWWSSTWLADLSAKQDKP
jgi:uncharacterized protein YciI